MFRTTSGKLHPPPPKKSIHCEGEYKMSLNIKNMGGVGVLWQRLVCIRSSFSSDLTLYGRYLLDETGVSLG
jgi:hypothetical protein